MVIKMFYLLECKASMCYLVIGCSLILLLDLGMSYIAMKIRMIYLLSSEGGIDVLLDNYFL